MMTNVTEHEEVAVEALLTKKPSSSTVSASIPSKIMHRYPISDIPVLASSSPEGLELLKVRGGYTSTIDPVTKRQQLGAFGSDWNSTRFEVKYHNQIDVDGLGR